MAHVLSRATRRNSTRKVLASVQATEFILDGGHGDGFCIGNIMKYAQRYGKKDGYNRKDLLKIIHYAIIAIHNHDMNERK